MASIFHQPGFRFHPTDVELIMYYLRKKVNGKHFRFNAIVEVKLYECAPWELKEKSRLPTRDLVWFFFCARDKKYASGKRTNRATKYGFWKTTGEDKPISFNSKIVGRRRTLIFYEGKPPKGNRTDWVMHEYRIENDDLINAGFSKDSYVVCKVFQKSGPGPKNGEQYGAPFDENEWDDDVTLPELSSAALRPEISDNLAINSTVESVDGHNFVLDQLPQQSGSPVPTEAQNFNFVYDDTEFFDAEELLNEVKSDAPITQENSQENAMCNDHEIYGGLDQIIGPEELEAGREHYVGNLQDNYDPIILTFWDGSFLEMDDLPPMQDDPVVNETTGDLYVHRSTVSMPASQEVHTSQSNWEPQDALECLLAVPIRNAEETVTKYIPSSSARGGRDNEPASLNTEHGSNLRGWQSKFLLQLDCIPSASAPAAAYLHFTLECYLKNVQTHGSMLHIQAVVIREQNKSASLPCMCSYHHQKLGTEHTFQAGRNSGFMLFFLLASTLAFFLVCIFTINCYIIYSFEHKLLFSNNQIILQVY